ncbi:MAG: hypothetical protein B6243_11770 [Anaerolineaceae bacterium 4572_5.2]|nr:MAG: hypothetical protein B6243_11770 [Anaerolineaceae bacterium 4572_5.2]
MNNSTLPDASGVIKANQADDDGWQKRQKTKLTNIPLQFARVCAPFDRRPPTVDRRKADFAAVGGLLSAVFWQTTGL